MKPRKLYYRHVRKALPPGGKRRKEYLQTLKARMEECLPQDASYEEYCQALGKPEELADAYLADIGCAEINRRMRQSRLALVLVCGLIVVSFIALALTIWYMIEDNKKWQGTYTTTTEPYDIIEEIIEDDQNEKSFIDPVCGTVSAGADPFCPGQSRNNNGCGVF